MSTLVVGFYLHVLVLQMLSLLSRCVAGLWEMISIFIRAYYISVLFYIDSPTSIRSNGIKLKLWLFSFYKPNFPKAFWAEQVETNERGPSIFAAIFPS